MVSSGSVLAKRSLRFSAVACAGAAMPSAKTQMTQVEIDRFMFAIPAGIISRALPIVSYNVTPAIVRSARPFG